MSFCVGYLISVFFFSCYCDPPSLHSFPTRRSSDLFRRRSGRSHASAPHPHRRSHRYRTVAHRKPRSEEHTSELQSLTNLVCRLLLEKKKTKKKKAAAKQQEHREKKSKEPTSQNKVA